MLLQYNNQDTMSLDELVTATGVSKDYLKQVLGLLVKAKILISDNNDQYDRRRSLPKCRRSSTRIVNTSSK